MKRALVILLLAMAAAGPALAGDTVHTCTGTISSLPAVIAAPGTWCLADALSTELASGAAITINANNVTLHCDGKGLAASAGPGGRAIGVRIAAGRNGAAIRDCALIGFDVGIAGDDAASFGHVVEANVLNRSGSTGIRLAAGSASIRDNRITFTGGATGAGPLQFTGILATGTIDVTGNRVHRLTGAAGSGVLVRGIVVAASRGGVIEGNTVATAFPGPGTGTAVLIDVVDSTGVRIAGNVLVNAETAMRCTASTAVATGNVFNFNNFSPPAPTMLVGCADGGGNLTRTP